MGYMGKILLYCGLVILILGAGPLIAVRLLSAIGIGNSYSDPVGIWAEHPLMMLSAMFTLLPGIALTAVGILTCVWKYLLDRLPY